MAVRYPELRNLLGPEFRTYKSANDKTVSAALTERFTKLSPTTVISWRNGTRAPSPDYRIALAELLYKNDPAQATAFQTKLREAVQKPESGMGLLDELATETRCLKIASTTFSSESGFVDRFFERFLSIAGVRSEVPRRQDVESIREQLLKKKDGIDVALGIFATIDRALTLTFFPTPIRIGLNGVVLEQHLLAYKRRPQDLREALEIRGRRRDRIFPVVGKHDVGQLFVSKMLGFKDIQIEMAPIPKV